MSILNNKTQVPIKSKLSDSNIGLDHKNCSYCNQPFIEKLWCKKCDPYKIIEGWTSENPDIDKFIKDTMYSRKYGTWLEWVPFDRFTNMNMLEICWDVYLEENFTLGFYGMTKDPVTKEFMMIIEFASRGSLRSILSNEYNKILWSDKIRILGHLILGLNNLHKLGYFHKILHSRNILIFNNVYDCCNSYISGKYDLNLELDICNGLRPGFGKGTPEIYKKLAYRCMNSDPKQRPKADELSKILIFWYHSINGEMFSYKGSEVKTIFEKADREVETIFEEADREIPIFPISYGKNSNIVYTS
ncbi:unnamed protein product [Rhizophagus irregularis]|nr:unnamed protein product [Rhizophagus irregularis]